MRQTRLTAPTLLLLSLLLVSAGCIGTPASGVIETLEPVLGTTVAAEARHTADARIETAVAATLTSQARAALPFLTARGTPSPRIALISSHGRYVTALGEDGGWALTQRPELTDCAWFTPYYLPGDRVALLTCHGRYVTAPRRGTTRWDWALWQESALGDCGQFHRHELESGGVALETCAAKFFTAGDGNWEAGLQWSVIAQTEKVEAWEIFKMVNTDQER